MHINDRKHFFTYRRVLAGKIKVLNLKRLDLKIFGWIQKICVWLDLVLSITYKILY